MRVQQPFYALASLVAAVTGTTVAIGPAQVHSSAYRSTPVEIRGCCGFTPSGWVIASQLFGQLPSGSHNEYLESCGRDPLTGQVYEYDPQDYVDHCAVPTNSEEAPATEAVNDYARFRAAAAPLAAAYAGECPYLLEANRATPYVEPDYETYFTPNDYPAAIAATEPAVEQVAETESESYPDETAFFYVDNTQTLAVASEPDWVEEYFSLRTVEETPPAIIERDEYASAELAAAQEANGEGNVTAEQDEFWEGFQAEYPLAPVTTQDLFDEVFETWSDASPTNEFPRSPVRNWLRAWDGVLEEIDSLMPVWQSRGEELWEVWLEVVDQLPEMLVANEAQPTAEQTDAIFEEYANLTQLDDLVFEANNENTFNAVEVLPAWKTQLEQVWRDAGELWAPWAETWQSITKTAALPGIGTR